MTLEATMGLGKLSVESAREMATLISEARSRARHEFLRAQWAIHAKLLRFQACCPHPDDMKKVAPSVCRDSLVLTCRLCNKVFYEAEAASDDAVHRLLKENWSEEVVSLKEFNDNIEATNTGTSE